MQLKTVVKTENGEVELTANLMEEEVQFLLEFAINTLMRDGALPFVLEQSDKNIVDMPESVQ